MYKCFQPIENKFVPTPEKDKDIIITLNNFISYFKTRKIIIDRSNITVNNTSKNLGLRDKQMFEGYYYKAGQGYYVMQRRDSYFSALAGLKGWNGSNSRNEKWTLSLWPMQLGCMGWYCIFLQNKDAI